MLRLSSLILSVTVVWCVSHTTAILPHAALRSAAHFCSAIHCLIAAQYPAQHVYVHCYTPLYIVPHALPYYRITTLYRAHCHLLPHFCTMSLTLYRIRCSSHCCTLLSYCLTLLHTLTYISVVPHTALLVHNIALLYIVNLHCRTLLSYCPPRCPTLSRTRPHHCTVRLTDCQTASVYRAHHRLHCHTLLRALPHNTAVPTATHYRTAYH